MLGAYIAAWIDWRAAFLIMGLAGIVFAPVMWWVVRDVPRPAAQQTTPLFAVFRVLARKPTFWLMAFASSSSSLVGYGLALWVPSILMRSFGMDIIGAGQFMGSILLVGGTAGVLAGGYLADRLGNVDRRWYALIPAIAWLVTAPFFLLGLGLPSSSLWMIWPLLLVPNALNILWLGPVTTAVQHLVERPMRATASACFLLINNFVGLGVGPLLIGGISESLKATYGADSLRYAAMGVLGFYLLAALLMWAASRRLPGDWVEDA